MLQNTNNLKDWLSTGSNLKDALISGLSGVGQGFERKGDYVVHSNYLGNGLASTGLSYLSNPNYKDYFSALQASAAINSFRNKSNSYGGLGNYNKRRGLYGSVADAIDKYARPTQYDIYSNNYGYTDNNYSTPISRGITDYFNSGYDNNSIQGVLYNDRPKTPSSIWNDYLS